MADAPDGGTAGFRLGYVPGATPGKWARTWRARLADVPLELVQVPAADAAAALAGRRVDAAVLRLPVDADVLHAIPLYAELPVVVVSRDHLLAATDEDETVTADALADDVVWLARDDVLYAGGAPLPGRAPQPYDDGAGGLVTPEPPATTADAIAWVATGTGATVVPMSLARLHHRKDATFRVLDGGPEAPVGLAWLRDGLPDDVAELVEEMIGIVRGRTVNSSRGRGGRDAEGTGSSQAGSAKAESAKGPKGASSRQAPSKEPRRGGRPPAPRRGQRPSGRRRGRR